MAITLIEIKKQLNSMIYLNIMSYSVLSECGIYSMPTADESKELEAILQDFPIHKRPYNIAFTNGLYKKGLPQYEVEIDDPYNFHNYRWTTKKQKQMIDVEVMANSIISCCSLIERILTFDLEVENPSFNIYILHKSAAKQADFIRKHLKVGNIFYNGEDVTKSETEEAQVQISAKDPDMLSQFAVLHAFLALSRLDAYHLHYLNSCNENNADNHKILSGLMGSFVENMEQHSTKELTLIGLHMVEIYKTIDSSADMIEKVLKKLAKELCQRISPEGNLIRKRNQEDTASPYTSFNCLNLLSQLAYMFSSKSCFESSHKLFKNLKANWDSNGSIYRIKDSNKQNYNFKTIASIISAMHSLLRITHEEEQWIDLQNQTIDFINTTLIKSGLFNGQCFPILQENKMEIHEALDFEKPWAPTFNKGFEFKISKKKYYCEADVFRADYVLPSCSLLLCSINS